MVRSKDFFHYRAFGLHIRSTIELPELLVVAPTGNNFDVTIREAAIDISPLNLELHHEACWHVADESFFLVIKDLATFKITAGKQIVVERCRASGLDPIRIYLLGTCMGVIAHQRGLLPIHGCTIATPFGAKIFAGPIGYGKSTLAAGFVQGGYKILADDLSVVCLSETTRPQVFPAYPQLKLRPDSAQKTHVPLENLVAIDEEGTKFKYPIYEHFYSQPLDVSAIYYLSPHRQEHFAVAPIKGTEKFRQLRNNTYRETLIEGLQVNRSHFTLCTRVAEQIPMFTLHRPADQLHIRGLIRFLEKHFLEDCR